MFGLGFIDNASLTNIKTFYSIKEDLQEQSEIQAMRGADNGLFYTEKSAKAAITIDADYIPDADFDYFRSILLNRKYPNKIYFREPGYFTGALLMPSTATNKAYKLISSACPPGLGDFSTEFTTNEYSYVNGFTTALSNYTGTANYYINYLFTFDLGAWLGTGSLLNLLRLSLFMQTPNAYRTHPSTPTDVYGIIVRAYNFNSASWLEIYRRSMTLTSENQQCAGIRPTIGYTKMSDFVGDQSGSYPNKVMIMVSTLQNRGSSGTLYLESNFIALLVNGFMVRPEEGFNMNWREPFTGAGRTGQIKLLEV